MIRTFQAKTNIVLSLGTLLPSVVLCVFFFWEKMPLWALFFMLLLVLAVERIVHTRFILDDEGHLFVDKGRLSRRKEINLADIERVELHHLTPLLGCVQRGDMVVLTLKNGRQILLNPSMAAEFCHVLLKKQSELNTHK